MTRRNTTAGVPDQFNTFGELLKFLRRRAGLTQRELSIAVGYSESQISRLEKNERAPDAAMLAARFVPALWLEDEPVLKARLLELGGAARQAHAEDAAGDSALPTTPNNLPTQFTSFIGRESELAEIKQLLVGEMGSDARGSDAMPLRLSGISRLITLTGPGGCGKTRLAIEVAGEVRDSFPDGVWFVEFASLGDAALVPQTVAGVLGMQPDGGQSILTILTETLRDKHTLLVLDNCEHLVQAITKFIEDVLRACPEVSVLATSREMLGAGGERSVYVPSLSIPEAGMRSDLHALMQYGSVRLFVERGNAVLPGFALNADNAEAIVQICQRLDGIPLALELAAARLRMLSVEQIAARLDSAFRLLSGGRRTALPRHQTLQALIDWSYELLSEQERVLFRRLAVFAGGCTLDAVEFVCGGEGIAADEVLEVLARLVDKSLVQVVLPPTSERIFGEKSDAVARYRLLETVRQYALAKLIEHGEAEFVRQLHAEFYLKLAEAGAPSAPNDLTDFRWLDRLETEQDNLRAALSWTLTAVDNASVDPLRLSAGNIWMSAWALNRLGWAARERGDADTAQARLEQSLLVYRNLDDPVGIAWTCITLGEVFVMLEQPGRAQALIDEGLYLARRQGETDAVGWGLNHLGHVAQLRGDFEQALELHAESLAIFQKQGNTQGLPWAHGALGEAYLALGDTARARTSIADGLDAARRKRDKTAFSWGLAALGGVAALEQDPAQAAWYWGAAEAIRRSSRARISSGARATLARLRAMVRAQLGEEPFNAACGYSATLAEAASAAGNYLHPVEDGARP